MQFLARIKPDSLTAKKLDREHTFSAMVWGQLFTRDIFGYYSSDLDSDVVKEFQQNPEVVVATFTIPFKSDTVYSSLGEGASDDALASLRS